MAGFALQLQATAVIAAAVGYLVLLGLTWRMRGLPGLVERLFALYLVVSSVWVLAWGLGNVWRWVQAWVVETGAAVAIYTSALLPVVLALLTLHFLGQRGLPPLPVLGVTGVWLALVILGERGLLVEATVMTLVRFLVWLALIFVAVAMTVVHYGRLRRPLHRNRVLYWLVALLLVAAGEGLHYVPDDSVAIWGVPLRLLGVSLMTYAVVTYSLPDIKSVLRRSLLQIVMIFVTAALYLLAIVVAVLGYQVIGRTSLDVMQKRWTIAIGSLAIPLVLALLQSPVRRAVSGLTEQLLFGPGYDASRALRDYSQSISNILHIERLATVAIEAIGTALDVERGALLLVTERDDGGANVRVVPGMGEIPMITASFNPGSPVLAALRDTGRPLTQYDIDMLPEFRAMDPSERQWQWALDMEVYVPIHAKRTLIGALALGAKGSGEPYQAQDLDVLNTLAGQTAVALENARLFEDLRILNLEIGQLNEELTNAYRRLQKLDKAKTDFLNITSHELRTPLTQIRGNADILADMLGQVNSKQAAYLVKVANSVSKATDRLEAIYSAMLDISEIGVDALKLHKIEIRPETILQLALENWQSALEDRRQTLTLHNIEELPPIEADQRRMVQAFSNLINNAIKFTPDAGHIDVWGRLVRGGGEPLVEIVVADTGIGIAPEDQDMIFERFYRVGSADLHSTGSTKFKGAGPGLGLAITKGVIEGHGGRIWVESEGYDEETCPGSRFHVLLPIRSQADQDDLPPGQSKQTRPVIVK